MRLSEVQKLRIRDLRAQGATYAEIQQHLGVVIPSSSLSYICKNVVVPEAYAAKIKLQNLQHLAGVRVKAVARNKEIYKAFLQDIETANVTMFDDADINTLKVALAMLYLGEGAKWQSYRGLSLGSSSPEIIRLYIKLLQVCYGKTIQEFRARIQCRADHDVAELEAYWSEITGISNVRFYRTYIDQRTVGKPSKRSDYRGVCVIMCSGTKIQQELAIVPKLLLKHLGL